MKNQIKMVLNFTKKPSDYQQSSVDVIYSQKKMWRDQCQKLDLSYSNGWQMETLDIDIYDNFQDCEAHLQYLIELTRNNNPFLSLEWLKLWWEYFGNSKQLYIFIFRHKDILVGFAPFYRVYQPLLGLYQYHLVGSGFSSYLDLVCLPGYEVSLIKSLFSYFKTKGHAAIVYFRDINNRFSHLFIPILDSTKEKDIKATLHKLDVCPLAILGDKWEKYFSQQRDGKSRYKLKKYNQLLSQLGEVKIRDVTDPSEFIMLLPDIERLHKERFKGKGLTLFTEERLPFLIAVLHNLLGKQASVSILELDGTLVSFLIGFNMGETYIDFAKAFDPAFASLRLGQVHLRHLIERKMKAKITCFDFSKGDYSYKREWSNDETATFLFRFGINISKLRFWWSTLLFNIIFYQKRLTLHCRREVTKYWKKLFRKVENFLSLKKKKLYVQEIFINDANIDYGRIQRRSHNVIKNIPPHIRRDIIEFILNSDKELPWIILQKSQKSIVFISEDLSSGYRLSF